MPPASPGTLIGAASVPAQVNMSWVGSYMGGSSIGIVSSSPVLLGSTVANAKWIMSYCNGTELKMVQLVVTVSAGEAYVSYCFLQRSKHTDIFM